MMQGIRGDPCFRASGPFRRVLTTAHRIRGYRVVFILGLQGLIRSSDHGSWSQKDRKIDSEGSELLCMLSGSRLRLQLSAGRDNEDVGAAQFTGLLRCGTYLPLAVDV